LTEPIRRTHEIVLQPEGDHMKAGVDEQLPGFGKSFEVRRGEGINLRLRLREGRTRLESAEVG
jgi:hypothetical protein